MNILGKCKEPASHTPWPLSPKSPTVEDLRVCQTEACRKAWGHQTKVSLMYLSFKMSNCSLFERTHFLLFKQQKLLCNFQIKQKPNLCLNVLEWIINHTVFSHQIQFWALHKRAKNPRLSYATKKECLLTHKSSSKTKSMLMKLRRTQKSVPSFFNFQSGMEFSSEW